MKKVPLRIHLDEDLLDLAKAESERKHISVSQVVRECIRAMLATKKKETRR